MVCKCLAGHLAYNSSYELRNARLLVFQCITCALHYHPGMYLPSLGHHSGGVLGLIPRTEHSLVLISISVVICCGYLTTLLAVHSFLFEFCGGFFWASIHVA
jgi:hypothetical protein